VNDVLKLRLASACARGWRQQGLVNEWMAGPIAKSYESFGHDVFVKYGDSRVDAASYHNLRRRLVAVGFVLRREEDHRISLVYPE
jgi:hypothetical protein